MFLLYEIHVKCLSIFSGYNYVENFLVRLLKGPTRVPKIRTQSYLRHCLGSVHWRTTQRIVGQPMDHQERLLRFTWLGEVLSQFLVKCHATDARHDTSWHRRPVIAIVAGSLQLAACILFIKGVNGKFTPRPKITLIGLFRYFWVYIRHQKHNYPILESSHKNESFPSKNISLQTSIVGEAQELLGARFSMDESSSLRGFQLYKGMVIFISSYLFI